MSTKAGRLVAFLRCAAGAMAVGVIGVPLVAAPTWQARSASTVLVDEGHNNFHTSTTSYAVYANLMRADGFEVTALTSRVTRDALDRAGVLVTSNSLSESRQTLAAQAQAAGEAFNWSLAAARSSFAPDEIAAIEGWVRDGGGLLLVLDHPPYAGAAAALAAAFGADVRNVQTRDPLNQERDMAGRLVFSRDQGRIGNHAVTVGVDRVITYTGSSIGAPPGATLLLPLAASAVDRRWNQQTQSFEEESAAGRAQGVAFTHGRGRVVILGEAGMLASQPGTNQPGDGSSGILRPDVNVRQFAVNVIRWLSGRAPDAGSPRD